MREIWVWWWKIQLHQIWRRFDGGFGMQERYFEFWLALRNPKSELGAKDSTAVYTRMARPAS